ncbi:unnamed protein product [Mytilus edulis]|uniref:Integrase catalytic domain-containing protein n=1 Tax=Mytilus edulis TaxID=6550 RepID=A0A8S3VHC3_MYTED|nr:unnamed protein product [Mytilus edulis]
MGISPDSTRYTAFNTCFGTYKFQRLPMGLKTAPNTFQLLMDKVLHGLKFRTCLCYLDDVLLCSETFEKPLNDLNEIFERFRSAGLKLGAKKCYFANQKCVFLGHELSKDGIRPPKDRIQAITDYPEPKNVKQLRRLIGMFNWFRKFIPNFSVLIYPLNRLLQKNQRFEWKSEQRMALNELKTRLINSEILSSPSFDIPFWLAVDTSSRGIGYILYQKDSQISKPKIIRFGSKSLKPWQQSYGPTKLELLGMVTSVLDCANYLRGVKFIVKCDHQALQPLFQKQFKGAIYERWLAVLQQFSFVIEYKPAEQMQVADALSRCENPHSLQAESPTEEDPYFPYITDEVGEIELPGGQDFAELFKHQKSTSNDMSDNDIVHTGKEIPIVQVLFCDKNQDPYDADTDEPTARENRKNVTRKRNIKNKPTSDSAKSVNSAESTNEEKTYDKNHIDLCNGVKDMAKVKNEQRNDFEYKHIIAYLEDNQLPLSQKHARRILLEAPDYILISDVLYRNRKAKSDRNKSKSAYQLAVPNKMIDMILFMVHDSPLGGHSGIQNTLDRLRDDFYFPRMGKIVTDYVASCHDCQSRKVTNLKTKAKIVPYRTPSEPFQVWQVDLFGPLKTSPNGNQYLFTASDMFSKYLFVLPIRNKDMLTVSNAVFSLVSQFGVCETLISDQGSEFIGSCTQEDRTSSSSHSTTEAEVSQSDNLSASQGNDSPDELNPQHVNELRRSSRNIRLPARYQDSDFTNLDSVASETDNGGVFKVKRILAKKRNKGGFLYLVQKVGEPAENAEWLTGSQLPPKAQELMIKRPPPLIE